MGENKVEMIQLVHEVEKMKREFSALQQSMQDLKQGIRSELKEIKVQVAEVKETVNRIELHLEEREALHKYTMFEESDEEGPSDVSDKVYGITDIAKFFNVPITTVLSWFEQGRFEGVGKMGNDEWPIISEEVWFNSTTGARYQMSDVVKAWEKDKEEWRQLVGRTFKHGNE